MTITKINFPFKPGIKLNNFRKKSKTAAENPVFSLALSRGQREGWYPKNWTTKDYEAHLLSRR